MAYVMALVTILMHGDNETLTIRGHTNDGYDFALSVERLMMGDNFNVTCDTGQVEFSEVMKLYHEVNGAYELMRLLNTTLRSYIGDIHEIAITA